MGGRKPSRQISLESDENLPSYYDLNFLVMAAAAILDLTIGDLWPEI
jgi:hypothetical protein